MQGAFALEDSGTSVCALLQNLHIKWLVTQYLPAIIVMILAPCSFDQVHVLWLSADSEPKGDA